MRVKFTFALLFVTSLQFGCAHTPDQVAQMYDQNGDNKVLVKADDEATAAAWGMPFLSLALKKAISDCQSKSIEPETCRAVSINGRDVTPDQVSRLVQEEQSETNAAMLENWRTKVAVDEMEGKIVVTLSTKRKSKPSKPMGFPYQDTEARLIIRCDSNDWWPYVSFNSLNLSGGDTEDGYTVHNVRVKTPDGIETVSALVAWGATAVQFSKRYKDKVLGLVIKHPEVWFEFDHHGQGPRVYKFKTAGAIGAVEYGVDQGCPL
jgi:hypothetical protein